MKREEFRRRVEQLLGEVLADPRSLADELRETVRVEEAMVGQLKTLGTVPRTLSEYYEKENEVSATVFIWHDPGVYISAKTPHLWEVEDFLRRYVRRPHKAAVSIDMFWEFDEPPMLEVKAFDPFIVEEIAKVVAVKDSELRVRIDVSRWYTVGRNDAFKAIIDVLEALRSGRLPELHSQYLGQILNTVKMWFVAKYLP